MEIGIYVDEEEEKHGKKGEVVYKVEFTSIFILSVLLFSLSYFYRASHTLQKKLLEAVLLESSTKRMKNRLKSE
jgi:flagellar biosynthesis protein FlhB